jgi:hypothetical protein
MYGLEPGRYYWEFDLTTCGSWSVNLTSTVIDYAEPDSSRVVRKGTNTTDTEAFSLTGGDYVATTSLRARGADCDFTAYLIPVEEYNLFASVGDASLDAPEGRTEEGETRFYAVEPGHYYWSVTTIGFGVDLVSCQWSISLRPAT